MKAAALLGLLSTLVALPSAWAQDNGTSPAPGADSNSTAPATGPDSNGTAPAPGADSNGGCAAVSKSVAQQIAAKPNVPQTVPAKDAIACLNSVPNKKEEALKLVASIKAFSQWESTLAYLASPPATYGLQAVDILGGLDAISTNVSAGSYPNEYAFQASIVKLISTAHDGHFAYRPDVFKAFSFRNELANDVVTLSVDGIQVPKLYNMRLINASTTTIENTSLPLDANGLPPAITRINGQDAASVFTGLGLQYLNTQDQDSQWNAQMPSYAQPDSGNILAAFSIDQGESVTFEYENGAKITKQSYAQIRKAANFTGVNSGEDFYQKFCNPANAVKTKKPTNSTGVSPPPPPPAPAIEGFPMPEIRDSGANTTSGYFLKGDGYDDVAVLSIIGFEPGGSPDQPPFDNLEYLANLQNMTAEFLARSKAAGKTRLLVDVSGNGGGLVIAGFEVYSQIFSDTPLFEAANLRRTDSLVQMSQIADASLPKIAALTPADLVNMTAETKALVDITNSAVLGNLLPGGVNSAGGMVTYNTTEQILGPVSMMGDSFTSYQSSIFNESDPQFNLTGVGNRANPPPPVFAAENVTILTDGFCGSTCTLFSYLMIMQNNIRTVSVGGRPQTGPMQSMGGVEGAQVFPFEDINEAAKAVKVLASSPEHKAFFDNGTDLALIAEGYAIKRGAQPGQSGAVNGKNAFSHADPVTPLQFLYQPANCRFFYTKEMIMGPEATWKRAVDAAWNDPKKFCVEGSQTPLMGVVAPADGFFTGEATGGALNGNDTSRNANGTSGVAAGNSGAPASAMPSGAPRVGERGVAMLLAVALASTVLLI